MAEEQEEELLKYTKEWIYVLEKGPIDDVDRKTLAEHLKKLLVEPPEVSPDTEPEKKRIKDTLPDDDSIGYPCTSEPLSLPKADIEIDGNDVKVRVTDAPMPDHDSLTFSCAHCDGLFDSVIIVPEKGYGQLCEACYIKYVLSKASTADLVSELNTRKEGYPSRFVRWVCQREGSSCTKKEMDRECDGCEDSFIELLPEPKEVE